MLFMQLQALQQVIQGILQQAFIIPQWPQPQKITMVYCVCVCVCVCVCFYADFLVMVKSQAPKSTKHVCMIILKLHFCNCHSTMALI